MTIQRRKILKGLGGASAVMAAQGLIGAPAFAQNKPLRVGIIAPKAGVVGTIGECGLRGTLFAVERINAAGASPDARSSSSSRRRPIRRIRSSG